MAVNERAIVWDVEQAHQLACDVANAQASADGVVVNFGATWRPDASQNCVAVRMLQQIALPPQTAKNLRDLLDRLIADADADAARQKRG